MTTRKILPYVLLVSLLACAAAGYGLWRSGHNLSSPDAMVVWERGALTMSEMAYHADRIDRVVHVWQLMSAGAAQDAEEHPDHTYEIRLVIDTTEPALWIEDASQVLGNIHVTLPTSVKWQAELLNANGARILGQTVRLQRPGSDEARFQPEFLTLVGRSQVGASFVFHLNCTFSSGNTFGKVTYADMKNIPPLSNGKDYYRSMVVSSDQRNPSARSWSRRGVRPSPEQTTPFSENRAAWSNVETKLYRAIEGQVIRAGWTLRELTIEPRWDCSGAEAKVHAVRQNIMERLLGGARVARPNLRIDYLGEGVWYAMSIRDPRTTAASRGGKWEELPLEFLISADQPVPAAERQEWIDKGRAKRNGVAVRRP